MNDNVIYISQGLEFWATTEPQMWAKEVTILDTVFRRLNANMFDRLTEYVSGLPHGDERREKFEQLKIVVNF